MRSSCNRSQIIGFKHKIWITSTSDNRTYHGSPSQCRQRQPPTSSAYWSNINNRLNSHFINISPTLQLDNFCYNMEINTEINGTTFCAAQRDSAFNSYRPFSGQ